MSVLNPPLRLPLAAIIALPTLTLFAVLPALFLPSPASASPDTIYAVTIGNNLLAFDSAAPGTIASTTAITGLQASENIVGIDFRPATGQLYGLSDQSRLYQIAVATGAATQVGSDGAFTLTGTAFGFDFNPTVDRIRVVSDADQNFRLNPDTGVLAGTDTNLTPADPNVVGSAYTNNFFGAATTTLYGIDSSLDILVTQGGVDGNPSPNGGQLFTVGSLGVNTDANVGFDVSGTSGTAFASLTPPPNGSAVSELFTIDLTTGAATLVGAIGGGEIIRDISAAPPPLPTPTLTASPTAAATATPTSTATQPAALPPTGGQRDDGSALILIALIGALTLASAGLAVGYRLTRAR